MSTYETLLAILTIWNAIAWLNNRSQKRHNMEIAKNNMRMALVNAGNAQANLANSQRIAGIRSTAPDGANDISLR